MILEWIALKVAFAVEGKVRFLSSICLWMITPLSGSRWTILKDAPGTLILTKKKKKAKKSKA
uniref:Uncharacterized protein n=1 Tax=Glossina pallidipes TaxID=7398 RepID=A0A1A9Z3V6_GLOPL